MNTTLRITKYAGTAVAGLAISCTLSAPALAMRPPAPEPGNGPVVAAPQSAGHEETIASDGTDWSSLGTGLVGGAAFTGLVVLAGSQVRRQRRQSRTA